MIRRYWPLLALPALLLATWLAYHPGLAGGFLFDDFVNLDALNSPGPVDNWPAFWRYITSGHADPTGRPLALLTFLIDARSWPADPAPFLRTNLVLHLLNGALLFILLRMLTRRLDGNDLRAPAVALLGAGLWLLHPLFVSTTLYIVQREAMLPATFSLLGLIAYVHGRALVDRGQARIGMPWMVAGICAGTVLATLCKANGVLLPLLAWVLEVTVLRRQATTSDRNLRWLRIGLLILPSMLVLAYIGSFLLELNAHQGHRLWTIGQRLLTEPRVLLDYLHLLVVPRVLTTGLYNDGYVLSTSLLQPASTLPAIVAVATLLALGFGLRRRAPAIAAALLFFFAGHALESSTIPLELYFEHRNYLPAMLFFWPLALALARLPATPLAKAIVGIALLAICGLTTYQRAVLWGQQEKLAQLWAVQNPASSRAQATSAIFEARSGRADRAMQRLAPLWQQRPHDLQLALNYAHAACGVHGLSQNDVGRVAAALRHAEEGHMLVFGWLDRALVTAASGGCPGMDLTTIETWLASASDNPIMKSPGRTQDLQTIFGRMALLRGQPDIALEHFNNALTAYVTPSAAAMQAVILATKGHYAHALAHLDYYGRIAHRKEVVHGWSMRRLHAHVLDAQDYWPHELALLRSKLSAEIAAESDTTPDKASRPNP